MRNNASLGDNELRNICKICFPDLTNPKTNKKTAGFTEKERQGFTDLLGAGYVDSFRELYPEQAGAYTFWTYMGNARAKNVGW